MTIAYLLKRIKQLESWENCSFEVLLSWSMMKSHFGYQHSNNDPRWNVIIHPRRFHLTFQTLYSIIVTSLVASCDYSIFLACIGLSTASILDRIYPRYFVHIIRDVIISIWVVRNAWGHLLASLNRRRVSTFDAQLNIYYIKIKAYFETDEVLLY